jgi:hypothetical protein
MEGAVAACQIWLISAKPPHWYPLRVRLYCYTLARLPLFSAAVVVVSALQGPRAAPQRREVTHALALSPHTYMHAIYPSRCSSMHLCLAPGSQAVGHASSLAGHSGP